MLLFLGTGKTNAARLMARMFKNAGVLPSNKVVELSGECELTFFIVN